MKNFTFRIGKPSEVPTTYNLSVSEDGGFSDIVGGFMALATTWPFMWLMIFLWDGSEGVADLWTSMFTDGIFGFIASNIWLFAKGALIMTFGWIKFFL